MNAWRHLKLQNPSGISPLSKNDLVFLVRLFTTMWHKQEHKRKGHEHYIFMCFCARSTGQQRHETLWNMWNMSGVLQGLGTGIVKHPPLSHPPSLTHLPPCLFYRQFPRAVCSEVLRKRGNTPSLHTAAEMTAPVHEWWVLSPAQGAYVHVWTVTAHGAGLVKREGRRSRQASISPLMVEGGVLSYVFAAKVIYPLFLKSQIITGTERGGGGLLSSSRCKNTDCSLCISFRSKQVLNLS